MYRKIASEIYQLTPESDPNKITRYTEIIEGEIVKVNKYLDECNANKKIKYTAALSLLYNLKWHLCIFLSKTGGELNPGTSGDSSTSSMPRIEWSDVKSAFKKCIQYFEARRLRST